MASAYASGKRECTTASRVRARNECATAARAVAGQLKDDCEGTSPMGLRAQPARGADATTRASDHPRHASWVTATRGAVKSDRRKLARMLGFGSRGRSGMRTEDAEE